MTKILKRSYIKVILLITILLIALTISFYLYQRGLFEKKEFLKKEYTTQDIDFFSDIAFCQPGLIRKWESDIKVQIDTTNGITKADISEVDKVIETLAPLVKPINIYRVRSNGNMIVHLNLSKLAKNNAIGYATFTDLIKSATICNAEIFVLKHYNSIIMHEFLHAIGISHPQKEYPFYTAIGRNTYVVLEAQKAGSKYPANSIVLKTWDDLDALQAKSYNSLSEQEKKAIKMLYSSDFKSGLLRRHFLNEIKK